MKKIVILSVVCLLTLFGCASNKTETPKASAEVPEVYKGPAFEDWRHKGFGEEIPLWFFYAYEQDIQGTVNSREDCAAFDYTQFEIIGGNALNADHAEKLIANAISDAGNNYIDSFWAKLSSENEDEQNPYCWVVLIKHNEEI